jgi:Zn-dependent protease with chaperone function
MNAAPDHSWEAFYYDGRTADREPVRVVFGTSALTLHLPAGGTASWPYSELRRGEASVEGGPFRLERGSPATEVLLFDDARAAGALRGVAPYSGLGTAPKGGTLGKLLVGLVAATLIAIIVLYKWALPAAGEFLAARVPASWEAKLGASVAQQVTLLSKVCDRPEAREPVARIVEKIAASYPDNPYKFEVYVVDSGMVNALAAPGGHIVVYRGLLDRTKSADELAAVLAHEVAHVMERHGTKAIMRSITFWALVSFLAGDTSGTILSLAGALEEMRFSREQEARADAEAMRVFEQVRADPAAMQRVFEMLEGEDPGIAGARYFSTHPRMADRVAAIERWRKEQRYPPVPVLSAGQAWPPAGSGCAE